MSHHHATQKSIYQTLMITALLLGSSSLASPPTLAASPAPGTVIENQVNGSFVDDSDNSIKLLESNKVSVTVAEVAGITVTANGITGIPNASSTVYFSFTITNVGNDPTQFYVPNFANLTGNATQSNVEITGYNLDGTTPVTIAVPITVTTAGRTGSDGTNPGLLGSNGGGVLLPGGSVTVRVPVTINSNAATNDQITVQLGDTAVDPASTSTPQARLENQVYLAGSNDVYTIDNPNGLVATEAVGTPINVTAEASAIQSIAAIVAIPTPVTISGKVWNDKDASANNTFTGIATNSEVGTNAVFGTTTVPVNAILVDVTTGNVLATQVVGTDGTYTFTTVLANTNVKVLLSTTAGTVGAVPPAAAVPTGWVGTSPQDSGSFNSGVVSINNKDFGIRQKPKLVLLKRITKINGQTSNPNDGTVLNAPTTDTFNPGVSNWPTNYLFGTTDAGKIKPNDTIEYTIYFLNNQGVDATSVRLCDPIRGAQNYVPDTIQLQLGAGAVTPQTDSPDATDSSHSYSTGNAPTNCNAAAATSTGTDNGGIAIGIPGIDAPLPAILGATGIGTPTQSYGLFRFTTKVKP
jgi:hypothetical protein